MKLEPLKQWICDGCGGLIESAKDGILEWISEESKEHKYVIAHRISPYPDAGHGCSPHEHLRGRQWRPLTNLVGSDGLAYLLFCLQNRVVNVQELLEIIRRLQIPYYEQGRLHWKDAIEDGYLDDDAGADAADYSQPVLQDLVETYSDGDDEEEEL